MTICLQCHGGFDVRVYGVHMLDKSFRLKKKGQAVKFQIHPHIIQNCSVCISIYTYSREHNNITISTDI